MLMFNYPDGRKFKGNTNLKDVLEGKLPIEKKKKHKYGAKKTEFNDMKFDSKFEAKCYITLKQMLDGGLLKSIKMQVVYILQEKFTRIDGKTIQALKYKADFVVEDLEGYEYVIDAKGMVLNDFLMKKKLFEYKYGKVLYIVKDVDELIKLVSGGGYNGK